MNINMSLNMNINVSLNMTMNMKMNMNMKMPCEFAVTGTRPGKCVRLRFWGLPLNLVGFLHF